MSEKDTGSCSDLTGPPNMYLDMVAVEGGVSSLGCPEKDPSKSRLSSLGVERRDVGVKGS